MDKNVLKRFAIESRKHLHEKVADRYALYYLDEEFDEVEKDELYTLTNEKHNLVLSKEQYEHRQKLLNKKDRYGKEHVIEESAFTWFNRFICLRYMEIHNFLPLGKNNESLDIRVLSSRDGNKEPDILKRNNLTNNALDINVDIDKLEKIADINEKYEKVLLKVCEKMGRVLPQIFDGETDYIELLMPKNQLNVDSFLDKLLKEVPEDNFNDIEVIGWLYQYYNQSEKDRVMKEKRAYKKSEIPYVTQIFTPDWIVKYMVENSLGRLWIEKTGDESLEPEFKYFIKDNIEIKVGASPLLPENITFIDPCMGSGHILVYAFEVFMKLYISAGYNKKDIPELILKNNLYGLDIDDRAGQFAIISVMLKAREYDSEIFNKIDFNSLNILSIPESNPELRQYANDIKDKEVREAVDYLIDTFENGKEIGSLLIVEEKDYDKVTKYFEEATPNIFNRLLWEGLKDIIRVAKILSKKYDVVVTNPPYLPTSKMSAKCKEYIEKNYPASKSDLCTAFMENKLVAKDRYLGMINMHSWMFLSSYEDLRKKIIDNCFITAMIHLGTRAFEEMGGEVIQTTSFVLKNIIDCTNKVGIYYRLVNFDEAVKKEEEFLNKNNSNCFKFNQVICKELPGYNIAYYATDNIIKCFNNEKIDKQGDIRQGLITGDNERFLKLWYEVNQRHISFKGYSDISKWFPINKGGGSEKWYSNREYVVNWKNNGYEIKNFKDEKGKLRSRPQNLEYNFKEGISWSLISTSQLAVRYYGKEFMFNVAGITLFADGDYKYIMGFLNSKVANLLAKLINPTINMNVGDIANLPLIRISDDKNNESKVINNVEKDLNLVKQDWDSFETSWDFKKHPLV